MSHGKHGTSGGVEITDELVERLAAEAEQGYSADQLRTRPRRGRPPLGSEAAALFQVRLEHELRDNLTSAARLQQMSPSEMTRRALRQYLEALDTAAAADTRSGAQVREDSEGRTDIRGASAVPNVALADQKVLMGWADSIPARSEFPRLVRRLILETGKGVVQLGFPAGEGVAVGGWDGSVRAAEPSAFIPAGLSHWELSVEKSVGRKADSDYTKRLATVDGSPTTSCSYVAASLRRWKDREAWATQRAADGRWAEVRAYGIDDIETWLEDAPVTHAWISEELGLAPHGLRAAESWWSTWASATTPDTTAPLVLAGRDGFRDELCTRMDGRPQLTTIRAGNVEEVLAAVAAVAVQAADAGDPRLLARMAYVDDVQTWRALVARQGKLILIAASEAVAAEASSHGVHHAIVPITAMVEADIDLPQIDAEKAASVLEAEGLDERRAQELGFLARRSLVAFRRSIANRPELHVPGWAHPPVRRPLRGVLLANAWQDSLTGDRAVLSALSGVEYEELRETTAALATHEDPLVTSVGKLWSLVSPFDAWALLGPRLYGDDLERFGQAARDVLLSEPGPLFERDSTRPEILAYSDDLRRGIAESLALLGVHGEKIEIGETSGSQWASHFVRELLKTANSDDSCRLWSAIEEHLPLLAEAAPDQFLNAVRHGTSGTNPLLAKMFTDGKGTQGFGRRSAHTGLLWALENTAWSRDYFGQTIDLIARLAEIDPGGRLGNRPSESLSAIYWPFRPGTSSDGSSRLATLDSLRTRHRAVAWSLMVDLIPNAPSIHMPTYEPRFRNWKETVSTTMGDVLAFVTEIVRRLLIDAETEEHWVVLVGKLADLPPDERQRVSTALMARLDDGSIQVEDTSPLWDSVRDLIARHRRYADADWALPEAELQSLVALEMRLRPAQPLSQFAWLFAEYMPDLEGATPSDDLGRYENELAQRRRDAIQQILQSGGLVDARRLARSSPVAWSVGVAIADATDDTYANQILEILTSEDASDVELSNGYSTRRFFGNDWDWVNPWIADDSVLSTEQKARLLLATRDFPRAWEVADQLGEHTALDFWKTFVLYGLGTDFPYVQLASKRLLGVKRYAAALHLITLYERRNASAESAKLLADLLEGILADGASDPELRSLRELDFALVFEILDSHVDELGWERTARLQWSFLPTLGHRPQPVALHRLLSSDPNFFVEVVGQVYRARGAARDEESSPEEVRVATNGYRLLSSWSTPPGLDENGELSEELLREWVHTAVSKLATQGRNEVGEIHIGQVLAQAPADQDGAWPALAVRSLLEELQSERIETGFVMAVINSRGTTVRGPGDGGLQEQELAAKYARLADNFINEWPRTATVLRSIADHYRAESRREETSAERFRSGIER